MANQTEHPDHPGTRQIPPRSATGRGHYLADHQTRISDTDWADSLAVRQAAQAVVGMICDQAVEEVWVSTDRTQVEGGRCLFTGSGEAHLASIPLLAAPLADTRRLAELGYDEMTRAAAETLRGQADLATVYERLREGWVIWWSQAHRDAHILLEERAVWEAITTLSEELRRRGRLTDATIRDLIGDPAELTDHPVWRPTLP